MNFATSKNFMGSAFVAEVMAPSTVFFSRAE